MGQNDRTGTKKKLSPADREREKEEKRKRAKRLRENLMKLMKGTIFDVPVPKKKSIHPIPKTPIYKKIDPLRVEGIDHPEARREALKWKNRNK